MHQRICSGRRPKANWRTITVGQVVFLGLLLFTANARGQSKGDITNKPSPMPTPSAPIGRSTDPLGFPSMRPNPTGLPPSSVVELKSSLVEMKENVRLLEVINQELQGALSSAGGPDYPTVITDARDINKLAIRIMRNLTLRPAESRPASETQSPSVSVEELKASIAALDGTVRTLLNDTMPAQPRTVDAGQLGKAGGNLEIMVRLSAVVRKEAEALANVAGKSGKSSAHTKTRLKPSTSMQLSIECNAWSMADLLKRSAQTKGHEKINVGVEAQSRRHQLAETDILSIDDCVDGATYEKGIADNVQYVAMVTDFTSYEVKGRVFAYRVPYKIGFSKNGKVEKSFNQIVSFYYVDEAGDGAFELLTRPIAFGLVPDWAKELAQKH